MASQPTALTPARPSRFQTALVWAGTCAIVALALWFDANALWNYGHFDAAHYFDFWKAKWWLVGHLGGGSIALLLGPFQFSTALRRRYPAAHRWMGRLYLGGVAIGVVSATYMGLWITEPRAFGVALLFLDGAWALTSGIALLAALKRQFAAHREWMYRSYVVTFAFVLFRFGVGPLGLFKSLGNTSALAMMVWVAWVVPLMITNVVLDWRRVVGSQ